MLDPEQYLVSRDGGGGTLDVVAKTEIVVVVAADKMLPKNEETWEISNFQIIPSDSDDEAKMKRCSSW
jgi:hypothetical protein